MGQQLIQTTLHPIFKSVTVAFLLMAIWYELPFSKARADVPIQVTRALERIAAEDMVVVDATIHETIVAHSTIFSSNFCYPPSDTEAQKICSKTIYNPQVMYEVVLEYLTRILEERPVEVKAPGSLFAERIGKSLNLAGWPETILNQSGIIVLPTEFEDVNLYIETALERTLLGSGAKYLIAAPGQLSLIAEIDGKEVFHRNVTVYPRTEVHLEIPDHIPQEHFVGDISPGLEKFCSKQADLSVTALSAGFNFGRSKIVENKKDQISYLAPVVNQPGINISIGDRTGNCGDGCIEGIGIAFVEAIAVWRSGCARCNANSLAVVRVGDNVWIDKLLAERILLVVADELDSEFLDLSKSRPSEEATQVTAPAVGVPLTMVHRYQWVDSRLEREICSLTSPAPWLSDAESLICSATKPMNNMLNPELVLVSGSTNCGGPDDFIACAPAGGVIEITTTGGSLTIPRFGNVGNEDAEGGLPVDIRHVLLHEVGHWFGMPHHWNGGQKPSENLTQERPDIMDPTLGDGDFCVSGQSLAILNNAVDTRWPFRVSGRVGLRRKSH